MTRRRRQRESVHGQPGLPQLWALGTAAVVCAALVFAAVAAPLGHLSRHFVTFALAGGAVASAALVVAIARRRRHQRSALNRLESALFRAGEAFAEAENEVAVAQVLADAAREAVDATLAWVARWDAGTLRAVPVAARAERPELLARLPAAFVLAPDANRTEDPLATALAQGRSRLIGETQLAALHAGWAEVAVQAGCRSVLLLPLRTGREVWGVAGFCYEQPPEAESRRLLQTLARRAGHTLTSLSRHAAGESPLTAERERQRAVLLNDVSAAAIGATEVSAMLRSILAAIARAEGVALTHRDGFVLAPSAGIPTRFVAAANPQPGAGLLPMKVAVACGEHDYGELSVSVPPDLADVERNATGKWLHQVATLTALGMARLHGDEGLAASEARYRTILEALRVGYFEVSRSGRFVYVNESAAAIFGRTPHELLGSSYREFMDEATQKWLFGIYNAAWRGGGTALANGYAVQRPDGSRRLVSTSALVREGLLGEAVGFRGIIIDETERHLAEHRLRENEAMFRALAESSPVAILMHQDLHWIFANRAAEELTGRSRDALIGRPILEVIAPEAHEDTRQEAMARMRGEPAAVSYISEVLRPDGSRRTVEIYGNQITYDDRPAAVISVIDVTRQRDVLDRAQRIAALLDAAEALAAVGSFEWYPPAETLLVSPTFSGLTGRPFQMSRLTLPDFLECFEDAEHPRIEQLLNEAARASEPHQITVHLAGESGPRPYLLRAGPYVIDQPDSVAVVGAIRPLDVVPQLDTGEMSA